MRHGDQKLEDWMISINIPGFGDLELRHLVCDYNGTLACDGVLLPGVAESLKRISKELELHVVTADTFGVAVGNLKGLPVRLTILSVEAQDKAKADYIRKIGAGGAVSIGNGRNDRLMLKESAIGICLLQEEGAAAQSLREADIVCRSAVEAVALLENPKRLIATLRS